MAWCRPELAAALQESLRHKSQRQQQPPPAAANTPESASGSSGMLGGAMLGGVSAVHTLLKYCGVAALGLCAGLCDVCVALGS